MSKFSHDDDAAGDDVRAMTISRSELKMHTFLVNLDVYFLD